MTETYTFYSKRLDRFFVANNIGRYPECASEAIIAAAEKKKGARSDFCDRRKGLRDLFGPLNSKDNTFEQPSELLQQHFKPKRSEVENPIDSIVAFKKKMKQSLFTAPA